MHGGKERLFFCILSQRLLSGEVTEWLKVHAWNACVRKYREFESHPLRH